MSKLHLSFNPPVRRPGAEARSFKAGAGHPIRTLVSAGLALEALPMPVIANERECPRIVKAWELSRRELTASISRTALRAALAHARLHGLDIAHLPFIHQEGKLLVSCALSMRVNAEGYAVIEVGAWDGQAPYRLFTSVEMNRRLAANRTA